MSVEIDLYDRLIFIIYNLHRMGLGPTQVLGIRKSRFEPDFPKLPDILSVSYDVFRLKLTYKASHMQNLANEKLCNQNLSNEIQCMQKKS